MTITTTQVTAEDALRAVADGKSVQMIWTNDGKPFFSNLTEKVLDCMKVGEAFLIVDIEEDGPTLMEMCEEIAKGLDISIIDNAEKVASSQENIADTCENAAEVHPEPSKKKLDDGKITALYHAGWSAAKIADEMNTTPQTVHAHLRKLREEGRL